MAVEQFNGLQYPTNFEPLYQYQQQTPTSFGGGRARLHALARHATVKLVPKQWSFDSPWQLLTMREEDGSDGEELNDADAAAPPPNPDSGLIHCTHIDVYVTSEELILARTAAEGGVKISYLSMPIVATQGGDLYLQLNLSDEDTPDDEIEFMEIRITANEVDSYDKEDIALGGQINPDGSIKFTTNVVEKLHKAAMACQELNPDPKLAAEDGEEEGEDTRPGANGWITSDNMAQFMDENGNFQMPEGATFINGDGDHEEQEQGEEEEQEPLGPGAGTTRTAAEAVESGTLEEVDRPRPSGSGT